MRCLFSACKEVYTVQSPHIHHCWNWTSQTISEQLSVLLSHLVKPGYLQSLEMFSILMCVCFHTTMTSFVLNGVSLSQSSTNSAWMGACWFYPVESFRPGLKEDRGSGERKRKTLELRCLALVTGLTQSYTHPLNLVRYLNSLLPVTLLPTAYCLSPMSAPASTCRDKICLHHSYIRLNPIQGVKLEPIDAKL